MATRTPAARTSPARSTRAANSSLAYVLHRYDWSESSLILDLFTREHGRVAVAAKGAKRPYSQLRSVLLPFQRINVTLGRVAAGDAAGEVQTLRGAEWAGGASMLTGASLFSGFYLNELLMKLLARHDPHAALFDFYAATLPELAATRDSASGADDIRAQSALRAFELALLRETGLLPDLSLVTQTQQPVREEQGYGLSADAGVVLPVDSEAGVPGRALVELQAALLHGSPAALQQACRPVAGPLKALARGMIRHHLGSSVLRTRQVMAGLQGL